MATHVAQRDVEEEFRELLGVKTKPDRWCPNLDRVAGNVRIASDPSFACSAYERFRRETVSEMSLNNNSANSSGVELV